MRHVRPCQGSQVCGRARAALDGLWRCGRRWINPPGPPQRTGARLVELEGCSQVGHGVSGWCQSAAGSWGQRGRAGYAEQCTDRFPGEPRQNGKRGDAVLLVERPGWHYGELCGVACHTTTLSTGVTSSSGDATFETAGELPNNDAAGGQLASRRSYWAGDRSSQVWNTSHAGPQWPGQVLSGLTPRHRWGVGKLSRKGQQQ